MEVQVKTPFLGGPSVFVKNKSKAARLHKGRMSARRKY